MSDCTEHKHPELPVDFKFSTLEALYRALDPRWYPTKEAWPLDVPPPLAVQFPGFSVNRGKYSRPEDVVRPPRELWGIMQFPVGVIPPKLPLATAPVPGARTFKCFVVHLPEPDNRAHCHVCCEPEDGGKGEPAKTLKLQFREILSQQSKVTKEPTLPKRPGPEIP